MAVVNIISKRVHIKRPINFPLCTLAYTTDENAEGRVPQAFAAGKLEQDVCALCMHIQRNENSA